MKKLMMVAAAMMAVTVLAEGPEMGNGPKMGERGPKMGERMQMGQRGPQMGPQMGGQLLDPIAQLAMNPRMAEKIGLTDEQKAKIMELNAGNRDANKDLQKKMREYSKKQMELLKADVIDEAAVMATIDDIFEVRKEIAKTQTKRIIAVRAILTPEQVAKAHEAMKGPKGKGPKGPKGPKGEKVGGGEGGGEGIGGGEGCEGPKCEGGSCGIVPPPEAPAAE